VRRPLAIVVSLLIAVSTVTSAVAQPCPDDDLDGFANCTAGCDPVGLTCGDCDDADADVSPDGTEVCNHVDDDCDGRADEVSFSDQRSFDVEFPDALPGDRLASALASLGDITGDGIPEIAAAFGPGRVRLISGATLGEICRTPEETETGFSVSYLGDVNDDGVPDFVSTNREGLWTTIFSGADCTVIRSCRADDYDYRVGGPVVGMDDVTGDGLPDYVLGRPNLARVTVFDSSDCSVVHDVDRPAGSYTVSIGTSVDVIDDLDDDGVREILVGLPDSGDVLRFGAVRIYSGTDGSEVRVHDGAGSAFSEYGAAVSGLGDLDGDGIEEYAIGAPDDGHVVGDEGSVWIHSGHDGSLVAFCPGDTRNGRFGSKIAAGLDLDGDGVPEFLVGSAGDVSAGVEGSGSVQVVSGTSCQVLDRLEDDDPAGDEGFGGWSLAMPGDFNGDGIPEIVVGSPLDDPFGLENTGSLSIYYYQSDCDGDDATRYAGDCDDFRADVLPGGVETCDTLDNDCDGIADEDNDGDGYSACDDCDNDNPTVHPGALERCNGKDDDCNGAPDDGPDDDGDGHTVPCDCDDEDPAVSPDGTDICNHQDDDCDGRIDDSRTLEVVQHTFTQRGEQRSMEFGWSLAALPDVDGDGAPEIIVGMRADDSVFLYSGRNRSQICRYHDTGASGLGTDVAGTSDLSGDGVADILAAESGVVRILSGADCSLVRSCTPPPGSTASYFGRWVAALPDLSGDGVADFIALSTGNPMVLSGADCSLVFQLEYPHASGPFAGSFPLGVPDLTADGVPDIVVASRIFSGADGMWQRNLVESRSEQRVGDDLSEIGDITADGITDFVAIATHLDAEGRNVGAVAFVSGRDGEVIRTCPNPYPQWRAEFGTAPVSMGDLDGDGFPEVAASAPWHDLPDLLFDAGAVHVISSADCRTKWTIHDPEPRESDQFGVATLAPGDLDGNGFNDLVIGSPRDDAFDESNTGSMTVVSFGIDCDGDGFSLAAGDCDDTDVSTFPGAVEVCDAEDNDCDVDIDEDNDLDGYDACDDCDNASASIYPGAPERCNGADDDCDGTADQGEDIDGDGHAGACDCDEGATDAFFGAPETCNVRDDDCDGMVDEGSPPVLSVRKFSDPGPGGARVGRTLAVLGDVTGDGTPDFVSTAGREPSGAVVSGADLAIHCLLEPPSIHEYESVAPIRDLTGDGVTDIIAGARGTVTVAVYSGADCTYIRGCQGGARGLSVTSIADINGDGLDEIFAANWGGASVYSGSDCSVLLDLEDPYGESADHFGEDVLDLGDLDADGFPEVAVVIKSDSTTDGPGAGSVVVFSTADGAMLRKGSLNARVPERPCAMTSMGDLSGDGIPDLAVSLCGDDRVRILSGADLSVLRTCEDRLTRRTFFDLTTLDDLDGDGVPEIAVGDTAHGDEGGNVVVLSGSDCAILHELSDPSGEPGDFMGIAMAAADLTGDGVAEILAGSTSDDVAGEENVGSVTVFSLESDCDGDGLGPGSGDCSPLDPNVRSHGPEICDGIDNDCDLQTDEALCSEFEVNDDGVVDGHELSWLGRAFGVCSDNSSAEWWTRIDYTADGCIDGDDLAILGFVWDCVGAGPICEP
jgi:hypothetical protein